MKPTKFITLQQSQHDEDVYIVDKLVNTMKPRAGSALNINAVTLLLHNRDTKVTINRAHK